MVAFIKVATTKGRRGGAKSISIISQNLKSRAKHDTSVVGREQISGFRRIPLDPTSPHRLALNSMISFLTIEEVFSLMLCDLRFLCAYVVDV